MNEIINPKTTFGEKLRFTPYAWAKIMWMRNHGKTEVAGYGITATEDPLLVTDFVSTKQKCTVASFDLDPYDIIEHTERMMDQGIPPWACTNLLIHTHPGNCAKPSGTDEENFAKAFAHPNWAIMFIVAKEGDTYCRLKINVGPGVVKLLGVEIDWNIPFPASDHEGWDAEYDEKVHAKKFRMTGKEGDKASQADSFLGENGYEDPALVERRRRRKVGRLQRNAST